MTPSNATLLRRTALALAASGVFALSTSASAQSAGAVRLESTSGTTLSAECPFGTMSVRPDGGIRVVCNSSIATSGTAPPPPPPPPPTCTSTAATSFALSSSGGTLAAGASPSPALQVVRTGSCVGGYWVGYRVEGDGCGTLPPDGSGIDYAKFPDGSGDPITIPVSLNSTGTTCRISLGVSGPISGTLTATYTKTATTSPPPTNGTPIPPPGCPAVPSNVQYQTFDVQYSHNKWFTDPNGTIIVAAMPGLAALGKTTGSMIYMPSPMVNTPAVGYIEYSISKCPGQISTDYSNACNVREFVSYTSRNWIETSSAGYPSKEVAQLYGYCWAPRSEGQWYLNIRHDFSGQCGITGNTCGVLWQWN